MCDPALCLQEPAGRGSSLSINLQTIFGYILESGMQKAASVQQHHLGSGGYHFITDAAHSIATHRAVKRLAAAAAAAWAAIFRSEGGNAALHDMTCW